MARLSEPEQVALVLKIRLLCESNSCSTGYLGPEDTIIVRIEFVF